MKEKILIILIFCLALLISSSQFLRSSQQVITEVRNESKEEYPEANIPLKGFVQANISVETILMDRAEVSLRAGCYLIRAVTDACVANAIKKGLEGKVEFRPTVYDVIMDIFRNLGIKVLAVKITEIKENTFIGQLIVQQKDKVLALDIRPSDATAIALRAKAPVYINESLAREVGNYIC
jgi:bifunctional DNase/RNase